MTRARNDDARRNILAVAQELFTQGGYEAVSMDKVAAAAGLKKANLFHYYRSKEALGAAVMEEAARRHAEGVRAIFADVDSDPVTAVRLLFSRGSAGLRKDCGRACFIGRMAQDVDEEHVVMRRRLAACVAEWREEVAGFLDGWKRRGYFRGSFKALEAADAVIALYEGGLLLARATGRPEPAEHAERGAVTIIVAWKA